MRTLAFPFTLFLVISLSSGCLGQEKADPKANSVTTLDPKSTPDNNFGYLPSAKSKSMATRKRERKFQIFAKSKSGKKYKGSLEWELDQKVIEYQQRMKAVVKRNKKEAKLAKKPRYSDPMYFGHKRKPKKRKPGKRKLCKECLIVH